MWKYNILLASADFSLDAFCLSSSIMWHWNGLVRGDTLIGKHFSHSPIMHGSWYGHYKGPLDDHFVDAKQSTCTQLEEHCPSSESLQLNPIAVGSINGKSKSSTNEPKDHTLTTESNAVFPSSSTHQATMVQGHKEIKTSKVDSIPLQQHDSTGEEGFFRRIWRTWFGHKTGDGNEENCSPMKCSTATNGSNVDANSKNCTSSKKKNPKEATSLLSKHNSDMINSNSRSPNDSKSVPEDRTLRHSGKNHDKVDQNSNFFSQFIEWVKFWKPREKCIDDSEFADPSTKTYHGISNDGVNQSNNHDLFSKCYFWDDMESFFRTPTGSALTSRSMTREELAKNLQKEGPFILKARRENQFRLLVDILISEKKWIEERLSWTCPFKLTLSANESCSSLHARCSNGFTSIFSRTTSKSESCAQEGEKQEHNHDQKGTDYSRNANNKQPQNLAELRA